VLILQEQQRISTEPGPNGHKEIMGWRAGRRAERAESIGEGMGKDGMD